MNHWINKVIVVTGGSEGLGRVIAFAFARQGASVVVLARSQPGLDSICNEARQSSPPLSLIGIQADVTDDGSVKAAVDTIISQFGKIDGWINNVGKSTRVELKHSSVASFRDLMEINFYSAVRCSLFALPYLEQSSGHLVTIGSLASRTGWPFVAPYSASKHALSAFHHQLRLEGPRNVHYLEVCSGPISRPDAGTRYDTQVETMDSGQKSASQPGAGVRLKGISADLLASKIELCCRNRKPELIIPFYARYLFAAAQLFPVLIDKILLKFKKKV